MADVGLTTILAPEVIAPALPTARPRAATPELSIVIVTWNSERWIERCLRSLPAACEGLSYEVVVYDNASIDGTLRLLPDDMTRVIRSQQNDGFAAGTNRALAEVRGRYIFLLNPDCDLDPRALTLLCEFLDHNPNAAAAAPLLVGEGGFLRMGCEEGIGILLQCEQTNVSQELPVLSVDAANHVASIPRERATAMTSSASAPTGCCA